MKSISLVVGEDRLKAGSMSVKEQLLTTAVEISTSFDGVR